MYGSHVTHTQLLFMVLIQGGVDWFAFRSVQYYMAHMQ